MHGSILVAVPAHQAPAAILPVDGLQEDVEPDGEERGEEQRPLRLRPSKKLRPTAPGEFGSKKIGFAINFFRGDFFV